MACPITDNDQRKFPLKQPDGWEPKVPRWTLRLPDDVNELVIAYVGVQDRGGQAIIKQDNYSQVNSDGETQHSKVFDEVVKAVEAWTQQSNSKPSIVNRFQVLAGRDIPGTQEWACYWVSKSHAEKSLSLLDLKKIHETSCASAVNGSGSPLSSHVGLWLEVINPDITRFETNYSGDDYRPGLAALQGTSLVQHNLTGYWGAARDRIRASAYDEFKDDSTEANGKHEAPSNVASSHLKGHNTHTIAHIRSGQFWERCGAEEQAAYEKSLEPYLLNGLADIFSRPDELGDYGLRFIRNVGPDASRGKAARKETCAAGFSRSLSDLESWAKDCPSHHKIYGGAIHHKLKFKKEAMMRTWHEISVLKPGEARWEYLDCDPGTGTIAFQQSETVSV